MANEIKPAEPILPIDVERREITLQGESRYFEKVENLHVTIQSPETHPPIWERSHYNLFVVEGVDFLNIQKGQFDILGDAILRFTDRDIADRLMPFTEQGKREIKTYPTIFVNKNEREGKPGQSQRAVFGCVTGISVSQGKVSIKYQALKAVSQVDMCKQRERLQIKGADCANELDREHWAIKAINIFNVIPGLED